MVFSSLSLVVPSWSYHCRRLLLLLLLLLCSTVATVTACSIVLVTIASVAVSSLTPVAAVAAVPGVGLSRIIVSTQFAAIFSTVAALINYNHNNITFITVDEMKLIAMAPFSQHVLIFV